MTAVAAPRAEYAAALLRARLPRLADRVARWVSERSDWRTGIVAIFVPARRIAYELGAAVREVRRALAVLRAVGWLEIVGRGQLGMPRYACTIPGRPLRSAEDEAPRFTADGVELAPGEVEADLPTAHVPALKTFAARMLDTARAAIMAASIGGRAPLEDAPIVPRDLRLELVEGTPQYRERIELEEQARQPLPEFPRELDEHFGEPRHVGRLYSTRAEAETARRTAARERASPKGAGDWRPHRLVMLAYRQLHHERGARWSPTQDDHRAISLLIRKLGTDAAVRAIASWGEFARVSLEPVPDLRTVLRYSRPGWE